MQDVLSRIAFGAVMMMFVCSANSASLDEEMRLAAKLHKQAETPQAMAIWQRLSAQGSADAAYNLAVIHQHGDGVPVDHAKAMTWYRIAAEQGDKVSQFQIGLMYQTGQGVEANPAEAHRWFTMHRQHHLHHAHQPQMVAWRKQALALIEDRDRREMASRSKKEGQQVLADLKQRAQPIDSPQTLALNTDTGR